MKYEPEVQSLISTYHKTGMLDGDALTAINNRLTGKNEGSNPCSELIFRNRDYILPFPA